MAVLASMQPGLGQIVYPGSDFPLTIQFHSSKEGSDHTVQIQPGLDLEWPGQVFPNLSGPEASQCAKITGPLPVSNFWTQLRSLIIIIIVIIIIIIMDIFMAHDP